MEDEDRPTKLRKLSHSIGVDEQVVPRNNASNASEDANLTHNGDSLATNKEVENEAGKQEAQKPAAPALGESSESKASASLSKNQLKKLRKREEWEAGREYRKAKRKQKIAEKKERKREEARECINGQGGSDKNLIKPAKIRHTTLPITILVDCGFDKLMVEKEIVSLGSQLTRAYSDNHKAPFQSHLVISSWGGNLRQRFDTVLNKHYLNWKRVRFEEDDFSVVAEKAKEWMGGEHGGKLDGVFVKYRQSTALAVEQKKAAEPSEPSNGEMQSQEDITVAVATAADADTDAQNQSAPQENNQADDNSSGQTEEHQPASKAPDSFEANAADPADLRSQGEVVYLTSDSPHTLTELKPYSTYIVGGLVDKNRYKGICYKLACEKGIKTAKLPIGEHMRMQSRFVLATNHVVEIMIRWLECGDWGEAFMKVIPKRKGGTLKGGGDTDGKEEGGDDGDSKVDEDEDRDEDGGGDEDGNEDGGGDEDGNEDGDGNDNAVEEAKGQPESSLSPSPSPSLS